MTNARKNRIYTILLLTALIAVWAYRKYYATPVPEEIKGTQKIQLWGKTMGTTYSVIYFDKEGRDLQPQIDSLLQVFNMSLSTYIPESEISRFNREGSITYKLPYFYQVLYRSKEIYKITGGAFDPTVGPLVNAWGFGPESGNVLDQATIDSLKQFVNFDSVIFDIQSARKTIAGLKLDFSAIAKGYGVDVIADYLIDSGIKSLFVEIGGEVYAQGTNERGEPWKVGVNYPTEDPTQQQKAVAIASLRNQAIATSGNYRNFYEKDGVKYSHTISPFTGKPVRHSLLSASVFAPDCMTADAFATAFMVLGLEEAKNIVEQDETLEAYLIYSTENGELKTYASKGIENDILIPAQ